MKQLKYWFLIAFFLTGTLPALGQTIQSPARWHWTCKKLQGNEYELVFHLELQKGWHVFADADDHGIKKKKGHEAVVPTFNFDSNAAVTLEGDVNSKGILETQKLKHLGLVNIYSFKVMYVQKLKTAPGTRLSGTFTYEVCSDEKTLDPITERFDVVIK